MDRSPGQVVAEGYDRVADRYLEWSGGGPTRLAYLARLTELLCDGSDVLELGWGAGKPVAMHLDERHRAWASTYRPSTFAVHAPPFRTRNSPEQVPE